MSIFSSIHTPAAAVGAAAAIQAVQQMFASNDAPTQSLVKANGLQFARESAQVEAGRAS